MSKTKDLFNEGFLDYAFTRNVGTAKSILLSTTDLSVITNAYGHLYKLGNLYDLLFLDANQRIDTPAGEINTADLRAFTWMRYLLPPGAYWKAVPNAYRDSAYCGGTPLALLGARNKHRIPYNTWHSGLDIKDIEEVFKLDIFLGNTLSSTTVDSESGEKVWKSSDGLIKFIGQPRLFNAGDIQEIRDLSGHAYTMYQTKKIESPISNIEWYNDAIPAMKHMIRQTWLWYGTHRSSNMILDYVDWDKVTKSVDDMTEALKSHKPKKVPTPTGWDSIIKTGRTQ